MPLYAWSLIALAGVAAWVAVQHGVLAVRQRGGLHAAFAALAAAVACQCVVRTIYHGSTHLPDAELLSAISWVLLLVECFLLTDLVHRFAGAGRGFVRVLAVGLAAVGAAALIAPHGFFDDAPTAVAQAVLPWGERYGFFAVGYAWPYWLLVVVASAAMARCLQLAWLAWRRDGRKRHLALLGSLLAIVLSTAANVVADATGAIHPPFFHHGFALLALVMGAVLSDEALRARRLQERLDAQGRLAELGQLSGGVAHDFGNILTGILGSAELLESETDESHRRQLVRSVAVSGRRGLDLVRQLTAFASGRVRPSERIDVHEAVREVVGLVRAGRGRAIAFDFRLRAPLAAIDGDPAQLHSLLLNLLVNARDATAGRPDPRVEIESGLGPPEPEWRLRGAVDSESLLWLAVRDNGSGMDEAVQARLFEPYFTTKGTAGTGIGLIQVERAVAALHGAIAVRSSPGSGSEFRVWLPLSEVGSGYAPPPGTRVLVWIPDASLRLLVCRALDTLGWITEGTADGSSSARPALIVASADAAPAEALAEVVRERPLVCLGEPPAGIHATVLPPGADAIALHEALRARLTGSGPRRRTVPTEH
jgi:signal transduction histidine kinase